MLEIAQFVRSKFACAENDPKDGFAIFDTAHEMKLTPNMKTLVGVLFCDSVCTNDNQENCPKENGRARKKCVVSRSIGPTERPDRNSSSRTVIPAAIRETIDIIVAKKVLIDSCLEQIKSVLREIFRSNSFEEEFMKKCGFESLEAFTVDVTFIESDLQHFLRAQNEKGIKASIVCYCGDETKSATATCYFRANSKWFSLNSENISLLLSNELATCWNVVNFKRHLNSHRKKIEALGNFPYNKQI